MRHVIPISGKDSLATAIVQKTLYPDLPYEFMYNDVGADIPDINAWLDKVEVFLGQPIERVGVSLEDVITDMGMLPSRMARYCTRIAKIEAMRDWLGKDPVTLYLGLRADELGRKGLDPNPNETVCLPLQTHGLGLSAVLALVQKHNLMPPDFFWQAMWELVESKLQMLGLAHLLDTLDPIKKRVLFAWRSRPNCYFCFFQRDYEWVGLFYHYFKLFQKAMAIEASANGDRRKKPYFWRQDKPLTLFLEEDYRARIMNERADDIVKAIINTTQLVMFGNADELEIVSCGIFCGK